MKFFIGIVFIAISSTAFAQQSPEAKLQALIASWEKSDGAAFIDLSPKLSKAFLLSDTLFCRLMTAQPSVVKSWLKSLPEGTFTVYDYEDPVDSLMQRSSLLSLKQLMTEKARTLKKLKHGGEIPDLILKRLRTISIKYVD